MLLSNKKRVNDFVTEKKRTSLRTDNLQARWSTSSLVLRGSFSAESEVFWTIDRMIGEAVHIFNLQID